MLFVSKIADFNKPWLGKMMYRVYTSYEKKVKKYKENGEWGNTLVDFAKSHGYMDIMPYMCTIDHMSARLMNAKLLRNHTVAEGAEICDYWYVGNKSTATK